MVALVGFGVLLCNPLWVAVLSHAEIDTLWRLRENRNVALHGRGRAEPDKDDLDLAKGLVNRILAFRAWRRGRR